METSAVMRIAAWIGMIISFVVTAVTLPIILKLAIRFRLFDLPGPLKIHYHPIPRLGGIALVLGLLGGIAAVGMPDQRALSFCVALLVLWLLGLADDFTSLSHLFRLGVQFGVGALAALAWPPISLFVNVWLDSIAVCVYVVVCINAFNFLDGSDGLAAGVAAVVALGHACLAGTSRGFDSAISWSWLGACAAFLLFNFPPAKIFMGDNGSTVMGFLCAYLSLNAGLLGRSHFTFTAALPILFAGIPLADFARTVVLRLSRGVSITAGDRDHFYDLLLKKGWSPKRVALTSCTASAFLVGVVLLLSRLNQS